MLSAPFPFAFPTHAPPLPFSMCAHARPQPAISSHAAAHATHRAHHTLCTPSGGGHMVDSVRLLVRADFL